MTRRLAADIEILADIALLPSFHWTTIGAAPQKECEADRYNQERDDKRHKVERREEAWKRHGGSTF